MTDARVMAGGRDVVTTRLRKRWACALALLVAALAPTVATACPACAGRNDGAGVLVAMAAMIALPFAVVGIVVPYVRRGPSGRG